MKSIIVISFFIATANIASAQLSNIKFNRCGTLPLPAEYELWMQQKISELPALRSTLHYDIPVVVHVIHNGENPGTNSNIGDAQIISQIEVLNEDLGKMNADTVQVPTPFKPLIANADISFHLATIDPAGNPTTGIDRIDRHAHPNWAAPPYGVYYFSNTIKGVTIWNPQHYMNIWVCELDSGVLGFATYPPSTGLAGLINPFGTPTTDGIVIWCYSFGRQGNLAAPYNRGRTATHETGHWLGLRHIWGDGTCAGGNNDFCNDTPPQDNHNFGCPMFPLIDDSVNAAANIFWLGPCCSGNAPGSMFMNYMDYTDDNCMQMFTPNQVARMTAAMINSPIRNQFTFIDTHHSEQGIIKIFPNPCNGIVHITLPDSKKIASFNISITDLLGRPVKIYEVMNPTKGTYSINLADFSSGNGLYILEVSDEEGRFSGLLNVMK